MTKIRTAQVSVNVDKGFLEQCDAEAATDLLVQDVLDRLTTCLRPLYTADDPFDPGFGDPFEEGAEYPIAIDGGPLSFSVKVQVDIERLPGNLGYHNYLLTQAASDVINHLTSTLTT